MTAQCPAAEFHSWPMNSEYQRQARAVMSCSDQAWRTGKFLATFVFFSYAVISISQSAMQSFDHISPFGLIPLCMYNMYIKYVCVWYQGCRGRVPPMPNIDGGGPETPISTYLRITFWAAKLIPTLALVWTWGSAWPGAFKQHDQAWIHCHCQISIVRNGEFGLLAVNKILW